MTIFFLHTKMYSDTLPSSVFLERKPTKIFLIDLPVLSFPLPPDKSLQYHAGRHGSTLSQYAYLRTFLLLHSRKAQRKHSNKPLRTVFFYLKGY